VGRVGVLGDVEIFLDDPLHVGEEGPVGIDSAAKFTRLGDVVGGDRDQPAVGNLKFTMELNEPLGLAPILGSVTAAAQDEHHRIRSLELGELPARRGVVGKLIVGEHSPRDDVRSHVKSSLAVRR
jgi:hypothetical protein